VIAKTVAAPATKEIGKSLTTQALQLAKILSDLHRAWKPHPGQKLIIKKLFGDGAPAVMSEWGRKGGKTETIEYFLTRGGLTRGGGWYYFAPEQKQAKEIVWASGRLQKFVPRHYIAAINNTEMRITLTNGSFIKVDGSDNFDSYRGIEPHGSAYDEFKDFRPEFHGAYSPNFAVHKAPLLICGTPPERDLEHYDAMIAELRALGCYFNFPTWINPTIDRDWLRAKKISLYRAGDGDQWEREYAAKRVRGGKNSIFPMWDDKFVRPHAEILAELYPDRHKLLWQVGCDPGNATVFGVLFRAFNPYTKKVYYLDEIYEREQAKTSTSMIVPRIKAMRDELFPSWEAFGITWQQVYDEAATWFQTEAANSFDEFFFPTSKHLSDKNEGLSLMKDQMLSGLTVVSDRVIHFRNEIINYMRDMNGKPVKAGDHLIDVSRYLNAAAGLSLAKEEEPPKPDLETSRRTVTPEQDHWSQQREGGRLGVDEDLFVDHDLFGD
jgi:hypothetical protein